MIDARSKGRPEVSPTLTALDELFSAGLLTASSAPGVYAFGADFERVVSGLAGFISRTAEADGAEAIRFPPVLDQRVLERNGYFVGFPHLAGCLYSFSGDEAGHRRLVDKVTQNESLAGELTPTCCAAPPAACYPLYPLVAARGPLTPQGGLFDVDSWCFRREPSDRPTRMQSFRMREFVRVGASADIETFRDVWMERAGAMMTTLGLEGEIAPANDPFFGSRGEALVAIQAAKGLKHELLIPIEADQPPTACMSFNRHEAHFAGIWGIRFADGALAQTGCVGFGMERLALALFAAHGVTIEKWPRAARQALWTQ